MSELPDEVVERAWNDNRTTIKGCDGCWLDDALTEGRWEKAIEQLTNDPDFRSWFIERLKEDGVLKLCRDRWWCLTAGIPVWNCPNEHITESTDTPGIHQAAPLYTIKPLENPSEVFNTVYGETRSSISPEPIKGEK